MKTCSRGTECLVGPEPQEESEFYVERKKGSPDRLSSRCKTCNRQYYHDRRTYKLSEERKRRYNLVDGQYEQMLADQLGLCGICRKPSDKTLCVDHDHECCSGRGSCGRCVRGLLCDGCNVAVARIRDDPEVAEAMARYLFEGGFY